MTENKNNRILDLLTENNMTQKELALKTGITESAISHYIKGDRVPRGVTLIKLAQALGVTTDDILNKEFNYNEVKSLIERNVQNMTLEEKTDIIKILVDDINKGFQQLKLF